METKTIKLSEYRAYPTNPNTHDEYQIGELAKSLDTFTQVKNIVIWQGHFIAGHGLVEAAKRSGITELEAVDVSDWPREKAEKFMIADNRTAELGVIDPEIMQLVLAGFDEPLDIPAVDEKWLKSIIVNIDFLSFDGSGDGGGSQMASGTRVRVVLGPHIFDIDDFDHSIYQMLKKIPEEEVKKRIIDMIGGL